MAAAALLGLAVSRACDGTDALPDVCPAGQVDNVAGTVVGVQGRRAAGSAPGSRRASPPASQAEAGLGRPVGTRRPDPAAPPAAADEPPRRAGPTAGPASAAGPPTLDLSPCRRQADRRPA